MHTRWVEERKDLVQYAVRECHRLARGCISCVVPIIICLTEQHAVKFELQSSFSVFVIYFTHECMAMRVYDVTLSCWQLFQPLWEFSFRVCTIVFAAQNTVRCSTVCSVPLWDTKFNGMETCTHKHTHAQTSSSWKVRMKVNIEKESFSPGLCLQERLEPSRHNSIISTSQEFLFGTLMFQTWFFFSHQWRKIAANVVFNTFVPCVAACDDPTVSSNQSDHCLVSITSIPPLRPCLSGL